MRWRAVILGFLCCGAAVCSAQQVGGIRGRVFDADFDGPVPGAEVRIPELDLAVETGDDGFFVFDSLTPGSYVVQSTKSGFLRAIKFSVPVVAGELTDLDIGMKSRFTDMEKVVVRDLASGETATEVGLLNLRETSLTMQDSVSKDLMSKAGASDAAGALKLVVGASVVDGKYATVRGLSDRYVGTSMNGMRVPSSDPKKRAVHLDVFPAGTIDSMSVYKTFTADLPGDYSGGGINIRTTALPEKPFLRASFSREVDNNLEGTQDFVTYEGGGVSQWARHRGRRSLPPEMKDIEQDEDLPQSQPTSQHRQLLDADHPHGEEVSYLDRITKAVPPVIGTKRTSPGENFSGAVSFGDRMNMGPDWSFGWSGALSYSRKYSMQRADETSYRIEGPANDNEAFSTEFEEDTGQEEVKVSQLMAAGLRYGGSHSLTATFLKNQVGEDNASIRELVVEEEDGYIGREQAIHYVERSLQLFQLEGKNRWERFFGDRVGLEIDWFGSRNKAEQDEPDVRYFKNIVVYDELADTWTARHRPEGTAGADQDSSTRIWRNTREENSQYGMRFALPFRWDVPDWGGTFFRKENASWEERDGAVAFGLVRDFTKRFYEQDSFYYSFPGQTAPLREEFGAPSRDDYGPSFIDFLQYLADLQAWQNSAAAQAYNQAQADAAADRAKKTTVIKDPSEEKWTDTFLSPDNSGAGSKYQDSLYWHLYPKLGDIDYEGDQEFMGSYMTADIPISKQLRVSLGARLESTYIKIDPTSDTEASNPEKAFIVPVSRTNTQGYVLRYLEGRPKEEAVAEIDEAQWLRSVGFIYALRDNMNVRFNWAQTIARPTFLELAPVITYDYIEGENAIGNANLRISQLDNYDIRWEWFPKPGEVFAISYFYKDIEDPIEKESFGYLSSSYILTVNYPEGRVQGVEMEARKDLDFLPEPFKYISLGGNYSIIKAKVLIPESQRLTLEDHLVGQTWRDMEGQPKYLANFNILFDHPRWGTSAGLFINKRGDMLKSGAAVGDSGAIPNIYESGVTSMNLMLSQKIADAWKVTFRVKNIQESTINEVYRIPGAEEDVIRRTYDTAKSFSLGVGCSF